MFFIANKNKELACKDGTWCASKKLEERIENILSFELEDDAKLMVANMRGSGNGICYICERTARKRYGQNFINLINDQENSKTKFDLKNSSYDDCNDEKCTETSASLSTQPIICSDIEQLPIVRDLYNIMQCLSTFTGRLTLERAKISQELIDVERKIQDELHYQEFEGHLSAAEGYKAYKRLHELRVQRRQLKNARDILDKFSNEFPQNTFQKSNNVLDSINVAESHQYYPRSDSWPGDRQQPTT